MKRLEQVKLPFQYDETELWSAIYKLLSPKEQSLYPRKNAYYLITKKSLDSRKKQVSWSLQLLLFTPQEKELYEDAKIYKDIEVDEQPKIFPKHRPVVLGLGPAGLFAAYYLALAGLKPIIIEQGEEVEKRKVRVSRYWKKGKLHKYSNVQFGEGGAGTFSDGKLATGIKNSLLHEVILSLTKASGLKDLSILSKPHIGTDKLPEVLRYYRSRLLEMGADIYYNTECYDLDIEQNQLKALKLRRWSIPDQRLEKTSAYLEDRDLNFEYFSLPCEDLFLATGHSSRELYYLLAQKGIELEAKSFAVGLRVEHKQAWLNACQYGEESVLRFRDALPSADYKLTYQSGLGRGVYSFCMCPGGLVVASASGKEQVVTNGMSLYRRSSPFANSALLVTVQPEDFWNFYQEHKALPFSQTSEKLSEWAKRVEAYPLLASIYFQEWIETKAYTLSTDNASAPAQKVKDFLKQHLSEEKKQEFSQFLESLKDSDFENANSYSYRPAVFQEDFSKLYPSYILESLAEAMLHFNQKMPGFIEKDIHFIGPETRSSAPLRILRDKETGMASCQGIYPCGEGAGYAGGISSAAVDGLKQAKNYIRALNQSVENHFIKEKDEY